SISSSSTSADHFPKSAGATLRLPDQHTDQLSPAQSSFSFEDRVASSRSSNLPDHDNLADRKNITRHIEYGAPGEKKDSPKMKQEQTPSQHKMRRRTQYFEGQFNERDTTGPARDRVGKDSPVIVELKTNVIIKDEYTMVTDLSYQLSQRYQRPESAIMVTLHHSACLLLGGSFDPAYILSITALPTQLQPVTNKRNAALLQTFMADVLGVTMTRGIIRFQGLAEENMATNGRTMLGEIERVEREHAEEKGSSLRRAVTKGSRRSGMTPKPSTPKLKSSAQLSRNESERSGRDVTPAMPSPGPFDSVTAIPEYPYDGQKMEDVSPVDSAVKGDFALPLTKKSKMKPTPTKSVPNLAPPPIPVDAPTPKVGKRKSLISIFKR
ncbi:hypothetical protein K490DRAFT_13356, partial [Saccharata proteae CBS 121410]